MRIYLITECPYGGMLTWLIELSRILKEWLHEIIYLLPHKARDRYWEKQIQNEKLLEEYWSIEHISLRKYDQFLMSDTLKLKAYFKRFEWVVFSYWSYAWKLCRLLYMFWCIKTLYHSPNCLDFKRFTWFKKVKTYIFEFLLRNQLSYYVAVWPSEAYLISNVLKVNNKKILHCPNFRSSHIPKEFFCSGINKEYEFIYIWRMVHNKGVEKVLNSLEILWLLNKSVFIWDWYALEYFKRKFPKANFIWRLNYSEIICYLQKAKYFISASLMEWLPFSLIEALSLWVIPIVSDVEWHSDIILNGYNWFLFRSELELNNLLFKTQLISSSAYQKISENSMDSAELLLKIWVNNIKILFENP